MDRKVDFDSASGGGRQCGTRPIHRKTDGGSIPMTAVVETGKAERDRTGWCRCGCRRRWDVTVESGWYGRFEFGGSRRATVTESDLDAAGGRGLGTRLIIPLLESLKLQRNHHPRCAALHPSIWSLLGVASQTPIPFLLSSHSWTGN